MPSWLPSKSQDLEAVFTAGSLATRQTAKCLCPLTLVPQTVILSIGGVLEGGVLVRILFNSLVGLDEVPRTVLALAYCVCASRVTCIQLRARPQQAVAVTYNYIQRCRLQLFIDKCSLLAFRRRSIQKYPVFISGHKIPTIHKQMLLGVVLDIFTILDNLQWSKICSDSLKGVISRNKHPQLTFQIYQLL